VDKCEDLFPLPGVYDEDADNGARDYSNQIRYLSNFAGFPAYERTKTEFLPSGEQKLERLVEVLKKAEKYIFLEYFSIAEGILWNTVLEVLKEKAAGGVDVLVIYDDVGCFLLLPKDYTEQLARAGIKSVVFNPFRPLLTAKQNNRDHRKIVSVDGKIAITGGINLSDEYINADKHYKHHWKDVAVTVEGRAAWSFTLMFLQIWSVSTKTDEDYSRFYPWRAEECAVLNDGLVQPYADSPLDAENVGEHVYLQTIYNAKKYVYITTPYLVINDQIMTALSLAAKRGTDVRVVTPKYPDKAYVHMVTRSNYRELLKAGVKIYEYTEGFIHSKTFISDDTTAIVGTTNLDYRSLYLSFECGVCIYGSETVETIRGDFISTLEKCRLITKKDCDCNRLIRLLQNFLRLLSPLL
jgi:cardiolipin synthase